MSESWTDGLTSEQLDEFNRFRSRKIQHIRLKEVLKQIRTLHQIGAHPQHSSFCMLLVGPSRSGKTAAIDLYKDHYPPVREPDRDRLPVLYVEAPPRGTPKGLLDNMLFALGYPGPLRGSLQELMQRVLGLLRKRDVEIIFLDEIQSLVDRQKVSRSVAYDTADCIKAILNARICPVVLAGTELAEVVLDENGQLKGRCMSVARFKPFGYQTADEQKYFRGILKSFERELPLPEPSRLAHGDMAARIHYSTSGLIGKVSLLLMLGWIRAKQEGCPRLTVPLLSAVCESTFTAKDEADRLNPFVTATPPATEPSTEVGRTTRLHSKRRKPGRG